jgi:hypothetical protein
MTRDGEDSPCFQSASEERRHEKKLGLDAPIAIPAIALLR